MHSGSLRNLILAGLSARQRERIIEAAERVPFKKKMVLFDVDRPIQYVYFPEDGVASLVNIFSDGSAVESATVGYEGMVGLPVFLGATSMSAQAFVQVQGFAHRLRIEDFKAELDAAPELRAVLNRYTQALMTLLAQTSACNRRHAIEERCARWLLMTHDRVASDYFSLTQEFLAMMLGVRRATVTVAAGTLHKAGFIDYDRGTIQILDRSGLERASCECYAIVRNEFARLNLGPSIANPLEDVRSSAGGETTLAEPDL